MIVLALNCGSSSVKFRLLDLAAASTPTEDARCLARGVFEGLPAGEPVLTLQVRDRTEREPAALEGHEAAVRHLLARLTEPRLGASPIAAVGHRVVHGGEVFIRPTLVDQKKLSRVTHVEPLRITPCGANKTVTGSLAV